MTTTRHPHRIGRRALLGAAASLGGSLPATTALAQAARSSRAIVGFPPGGTADSVTRLYAERVRAARGLQMVVDNRPGAGGRLALEMLKGLPADGNAFLLTPASMLTIYPHLYTSTLRYDPLRDFTPVTPVCVFPFGLAVSARHPARDLAQFIEWGKGRPAVDWASPVPGSMPHFIGTELARATGLTMNHVPYRGSAPAVADLLAGTVQAVLLPIGELTAFHRSGEARLLAVTAPQRLARLDTVPTFAEAGFPGLTQEEWYGILLPAQAAPAVLQPLHEALAAAAATPEIAQALGRIDIAPLAMDPAAFRERIARETAAWKPIVAASGFHPDE
ncbi:tripartite tricarboxylate transporter substrate-binding protein [Roseomonas sp. GC11]|uniref:Bug family tripartite tricarboxylate transporter substrate binding protein n=1 Tax=Roseomonas sp. GC11 TaxID=2950546 RepID=UPI00210D031B|nr:tripartite tricarboxylate transporter substrate-binding protein [Roseomonas sp. GC11]MCQ4160009.1 tripartite tricarboxylate transporter substrate-binding protein [Roseomonas sp. GC11]